MKYIIFCLFLFSCDINRTIDQCYFNYYANVGTWVVNPDKVTPSGIKIDSGGYLIDLEKIDKRIKNIEQCIIEVAKEYERKGFENQWQCIRPIKPESLKRDCLMIKIVNPIYSNCGKDWEFIGIKAPDKLCEDKGLIITPECPCMWRTAIFQDNVIISPPALYLWELGRIITSCNAIWASEFAKCLMF